MTRRPVAILFGWALSALLLVGSAWAQSGAARTAIEAANKRFSAAFAAGKAAELAAMYTADAIALPPNSDIVKGHAAIQKMWQGAIDAGIKEAALIVEEVEAHGDTAHERGNYVMKDASGKILDRGKYIVIWKQQQGQWKLHRDIWNTSMPATK